ncbi:DUF1819 family protein [Candidatus Poribacteria bacterium]|nr:DUF1819 family protein [Candidatus Poribacteria bacterium]
MQPIYKANITSGALLVPESRKIADLLLKKVSADEWKKTIEEENILQKLSVLSARQISRLIRSRLELMTPELWIMVRNGDSRLATHAVFAAAIKHSRILGDYLDLVVREQFRRLEERLTPRMWDEFLRTCKQRDPAMADFSVSTVKKMRRVVHNILWEVGYIRDTRSWELREVEIDSAVLSYLEKSNEYYVLKCIKVC